MIEIGRKSEGLDDPCTFRIGITCAVLRISGKVPDCRHFEIRTAIEHKTSFSALIKAGGIPSFPGAEDFIRLMAHKTSLAITATGTSDGE